MVNSAYGELSGLPTVTITRLIRRMRGESQAQLVEGSDGRFYVAKFNGNPQGNRTLVNEIIAHHLLCAFDVSTPPLCILHLPEKQDFREDAHFTIGARRIPVQSGNHFGSMCPVDPSKVAIFDFMPERLLDRVGNIEEFATIFVLDQWLYNTARRQAIFFRDCRLPAQTPYRACFIDHGMIFGGSMWHFGDAARHCLAFPRSIYSKLDMSELTRPIIDRIEGLLKNTIMALGDRIPREWFADGDTGRLASILDQLEGRRTTLRSLISEHLNAISSSTRIFER
jgi:hypothetical protein